MHIAAQVLVSVVALLHVYFLILEMFLWDTAKGRKVFATTKEFSRQSKALAANQGLYNGFLAAGLLWGLIQESAGQNTCLFFLSCIVIAGVYGAITVNRKIFFVQALPAILAVLAILAL